MTNAEERGYSSGLAVGLGLSLGLLIGLAIGLLYAPKPGKEMREELKTKGLEYFEKSKEGWEVALEKAKEGIEIGKAKIEELAGKMKESTAKIEEQVEE